MKSCLLMISCAVLMQAPSSAAPPPQTSFERRANVAEEQPHVSSRRSAAHKNVVDIPGGRVFVAPSSRLQGMRTAGGKPWNAPSSAVMAPQLQHNGHAHGSAIQDVAVLGASNVRHRGSNPPLVGGPASSKTGNTGGLDGTRIGRKP